MIGPLLRLATSAIAARNLRDAATDALTRALFVVAAFAGGVFALVCFTQAAFAVLEREVDPAGAWAIIGGFYALLGVALYFAATRRRR
ncbi:hypothetical protein [Enhydrobacter sp.]|jgi:hypothetical protein|uniref:hypothetical protein n=1 Tax=Enhydrobacter sp. TaxID=1894999 RepID=UPI002608C893|nr:hypothetical protein [Enhydrobacter sp.]WIM12715.1 MAG: hypothetical protein OJF58_003678 [Enhydrobacter sp.]